MARHVGLASVLCMAALVFSILAATTFVRVGCSSASASGSRVLALVDSDADAAAYDHVFSMLRERAYQVIVKTLDAKGKQSGIALLSNGEPQYSHLLHLAAKTSLSGDLDTHAIVDFMVKGGNVFMAGSTKSSDQHSYLASQFGIFFEPKDGQLLQLPKPGAKKEEGASENDPLPILAADYTDSVGLYGGISEAKAFPRAKMFAISSGGGDSSSMATGHYVQNASEASGRIFTFLFAPHDTYNAKVLRTTQPRIISLSQATNNARFGFISAPSAMTNSLMKNTAYSNKETVDAVLKWVFHENSVLRFSSVKHTSPNLQEAMREGDYRVKDAFYCTVKLDIWNPVKKSWTPLPKANHQPNSVMFELKMLDPYVRLYFKNSTLNENAPGVKSLDGRYALATTLPDKYGVFTMTVKFSVEGYTKTSHTERVSVHPARHDSYPRYLFVAYPYYVSTFIQIGATILLVYMLARKITAK